jgi:gliding motility-associated-like protein
MKKLSALRLITIVFFLAFAYLDTFAQLTPGDIAIIGYNGNTSPAELAIVTLAAIPANQTIEITDRGWHPTNGFDVANVTAEGLITWTTNAIVPAGTVIKISITPGATPSLSGLAAYGTASATGWGTLVTAAGGDNWFVYTGAVASPTFIYAFANWATNTPGGTASATPWQTTGNVNATTSYLPPVLAAGNYSAAFTGSTLHGDYIIYTGNVQGTKDQILAGLSGTGNWTHSETTPAVLTPGGTGFPGANPIFHLPPSVTQVTSSVADGTYKAGDLIPVNVVFSGVVNVSGIPTLSLNTGATANYSGGTGTNTLTFNYTVAAGQSTADLDYSSATALSLNGGTIADALANNATLTLAAPGTAGSLGANKSIVIDGIAPTVTSVNSTTANGAYKANSVINITLNFSEAVTVTGTPQLALNSGATVNYSSGSGTSSLSFNYTVQPTDASADLDYASTTALSLNGGTLKDAAGNVATLTLVAPGAANSLGANKNIIIDNTAPVVSSVNSSSANGTYIINDIIPVTVNLSEAVTVTGTPTLALNSGGTASYASGSGTAALVFNYTVAINHNAADLDQASTTALAPAGGTIKDAAGNDANLTLAAPGAAGSLGANKNLVINGVTPSVLSITRVGNANINGITAQFLVTFSENVTGVDAIDFSITSTGIVGPSVASVTGSNDTRTVSVNTGTGSGTLRLDLKSSGTGITNTVGNNIQAGYVAGEVYNIDKLIPTLSTVTIASNNASTTKAKTGDVVTLSFTASEAIGTPVVSIFGNATTVTNTSANNWTATYTTQATDANGVVPFNIAFTDLAGNAGTAVTATTNASSVTYDKTAPTLTTVAIVSNNASNQTAKTGNTISLTFTASEAVVLPVVTIAGNAVVPTSAGGNSYLATYILTGTETEGAVAFSIAFTDLTGNAGTAVTASTNSSSVIYDKTVPTLSTVTIASNNLTTSKAKSGDLITLNFTASETIATPTVTIGGTAVTPTNSGGNNWTATQLVSGTTPEGVLAFNIAFSDLSGNAGTPVTASTNSSTVTVDRTAPAVVTGLAAASGNTQNVITWNASAASDFDKYILYGGTSSSPNTVLQTIPSGTLTYTHTALTNGVNYFYRISAVDLTGNESVKSADVNAVPKGPQTITFNPLSASVYGAAPINLTATSSSGLTVTYTSSDPTVASVTGSTITVLTAGTTTITALQTGDAAFLAATPVIQQLVVDKKAITVTATAGQSKVYGTADPAYAYTITSGGPLKTGDSFTGLLDRAPGENIGTTYAIGLGTLTAGANYNITFVPSNFAITAKPITVTATAGQSKVYGTADPAYAYTITSGGPLKTGDSFTGLLDRAPGENIGTTYAIGLGTLTAGTNYNITFVPNNFAITAKPITVTATAGQSKVYGTADPAYAYTITSGGPLKTGDSFTGLLDRAPGENIGTTYAIGLGTLTAGANYNITFVPNNFAITAKAITVTATAGQSKVYGTADPAYAYTITSGGPLKTGDSFTGLLDRAPGENIGTTYAIGLGTLTAGTNYTITFVPNNFAITAKPITVTATAGQSKVYGTADPAYAYTITSGGPLKTGDSFTGLLDRAPGENIGTTYAIGLGTLTAGANYNITFVPNNFAITAKPITVTATAGQSKVYGTADPAYAYTITSGGPLKTGDSFTGLLDRAAGENIGTTYAIGLGTLTAGANYNITFVPNNFAITAKPITVTATAGQSKVYGSADPAYAYSITSGGPLKTGDSFTGLLDRAAGENIGTTYAIGLGTLTAGANYNITFVPNNFAITAKAITVTATAGQSKVYGSADPAYAYSITTGGPLQTGDSFTGALGRAAGENIGTAYAINQGNLSAGTNYTITFVPNNFAITAKPITVTATAGQSKVYGSADPAYAYTITTGGPLQTGDSFTGALGRAAGENIGTTYAINQGNLSAGTNYTITFVPNNFAITAKPITVTATAGQSKVYGTADPVYAYSITSGGPLKTGDSFTGLLNRAGGENIGTTYAIGLGTLSAGANYSITFVPNNFAITAKPITVTATAGQSKVYGSANPVYAYTITTGGPLQTGDVFTGALGRAAGENIGTTYAINQGTLSAGTNYTITFVPNNFAITAKPITVTATAGQSKVYGSANPVYAYSITTGGPLQTGDVFTGALARAAGENIGTTYAINQGTLSAGTNYTITFVPNNFAITRAALTITADNKEKFAGTVNPALTVSYAGFVNGESASVLTTAPAITTTATTASPIGDYPIKASGAVAANYAISYVDGILKVKPGAPTSVNLAAVTLFENRPVGTNAGTLSSTSDDPAATFTYSLVAGTGDTDNASFAISGTSLNSAAILDYETKASYSIRVRSTTQYGFSLDKVITINLTDVNEVPTLAAIADQTICYTRNTQNVALTGISAGSETSQTTTLSVGSNNANLFDRLTISGTGSTGTLVYQAKTGAAGTATVTVTVKDNGGTANGGVDTYTRTFVITVNALPVLSINSDKGVEVSKGETVLLNATGAATYAWATDNSVIGAVNAATLQVRPRQTTTYTVTGTNASGCSETKSFTITVLDDLAKINATNILTPNGDGFNDKWIIDNIDFYPNNEVKVFDKAGRLVYTKKGYDNSWEGTYNGTALGEGTYYYVIDFGTGRRLFKGFITIVRSN